MSQTFKRRALYALIYWSVTTVVATLIYSNMRWHLFFRVAKTAALWNLNSTLIAFIIFWLTRKVPLDRFSKPVFFVFHFLAAVALSGASVGMAYLDLYIYADPAIVQYMEQMSWQFFHIGITGYIAVAGFFYFWQFHTQAKAQAVREADLRRMSREAELKALKAQINPHFLFNTLNSINALAAKDPQKTRDVVTRLAGMLRYVLEGSEQDFVPLKQEVAFVEDYLAIEKTRLGENIQVTVRVEEGLSEVQVPPIILQPLVENSVKHGVAKQTGGGSVSVEIKEAKGNLECTVIDSGGGLEAPENSSDETGGLGLKNIRERLRCVFGEAYSLTVENNTPAGVKATLVFPLKKG